MLFNHWNYALDTNVLLLVYLTFYNMSMVFFIWLLIARTTSDMKTLHSFNTLKFDAFSVLLITLILLSMGGVPPLAGFFTKLMLLVVLSNFKINLLYSIFICNLLTALYFYLQNIRYIHQSNKIINSSLSSNNTLSLLFVISSVFFIFFLIFGIFYLDDFIITFIWLII